MNIDVFARIRHSIQNEPSSKIEIDADHTISSRAGGEVFSFQHVYKQNASNNDIFSGHVEPLVDMFLSGYNTCFICFGESDFGKAFSLAGDQSLKTGIIPLAIGNIFKKLHSTEWADRIGNARCVLKMYEIVNENVRDILFIRGSVDESLPVIETAEEGCHVKGVSSAQIDHSTEAVTLFHEGWTRRYQTSSTSQNDAATIVQLDLQFTSADSPMPTKSCMTFIDLPGAEKIAYNTAHKQLMQGDNVNRSIMAFARLVNRLSSKSSANRVINYGESVLTRLMKDSLGGNCRSRVMICLRPHPDIDILSTVLRICAQLAQIRNFPIINDYFSQLLIEQYRAGLIELRKQSKFDFPNDEKSNLSRDVRDELRRVQTENVELRDRNEKLLYRLEQLQTKFGHISHDRRDISEQLLTTEEEKINISKALFEMEMANTQLKEELENVRYDFMNKIMVLENDLFHLRLERDQYFGDAKKITEIDENRELLASEIVSLRKIIEEMKRKIDQLSKQNDELSLELLNLVNSKAAMQSQNANSDKLNNAASLDQLKAKKLNRLNSRSGSSEISPVLESDDIHKKYLTTELSRMKNRYEEEQKQMKIKIGDLVRQLKEERSNAQERLRQFSLTKGQLLMVTSERDDLQTQLNRLQQKVKKLSQDYRERLIHYLQDVAEHVDGKSREAPGAMRKYVSEMIHDLQLAHGDREKQLSDAAKQFKEKAQWIARSHEALVVAYVKLRQQLLEKEDTDSIDPGMDVSHYFLEDSNLQTSAEKEIQRLYNEVERLNMQLTKAKTQVSGSDHSQGGDTSWHTYRRKLREFTSNTLGDLEQERATLIGENEMLKEQLAEARQYINKHLNVFTRQRAPPNVNILRTE